MLLFCHLSFFSSIFLSLYFPLMLVLYLTLIHNTHLYISLLTTFSFFPFFSVSSICPSPQLWNELMCQLSWSSLQLLSANCISPFFMCRCLSFSSLCLCLSLLPPLYSSFTLSCLPFSVSCSLHPFHVCSRCLFYFPQRQTCQDDSATCPHSVWLHSVGMCMCMFCMLDWVHLYTYVCVYVWVELEEVFLIMTMGKPYFFFCKSCQKGLKQSNGEKIDRFVLG